MENKTTTTSLQNKQRSNLGHTKELTLKSAAVVEPPRTTTKQKERNEQTGVCGVRIMRRRVPSSPAHRKISREIAEPAHAKTAKSAGTKSEAAEARERNTRKAEFEHRRTVESTNLDPQNKKINTYSSFRASNTPSESTT